MEAKAGSGAVGRRARPVEWMDGQRALVVLTAVVATAVKDADDHLVRGLR